MQRYPQSLLWGLKAFSNVIACYRCYLALPVFIHIAYLLDMADNITIRCRCCSKPVPEARAKLGYQTCVRCAQAGVRPIREVTVAATSLQWF